MENTFSRTAGADLSTHQYKAVSVAGTVAITNSAAIGIQQNKPKSGEDMTAVVQGLSRYRAGAAVSAGVNLMVTTSGWFVTVVSGSLACGKALESVTSGSIGEGFFNFAGAKTDVSA